MSPGPPIVEHPSPPPQVLTRRQLARSPGGACASPPPCAGRAPSATSPTFSRHPRDSQKTRKPCVSDPPKLGKRAFEVSLEGTPVTLSREKHGDGFRLGRRVL